MSENTQRKVTLPTRQNDPSASRLGILLAIHDERDKQERKYPGTTCASDALTPTDKSTILSCEAAEVGEEAKMLRWDWTRKARTGEDLTDAQVRVRLRKELLQTCAVAIAWIEWVDAQDALDEYECPICGTDDPMIHDGIAHG